MCDAGSDAYLTDGLLRYAFEDDGTSMAFQQGGHGYDPQFLDDDEVALYFEHDQELAAGSDDCPRCQEDWLAERRNESLGDGEIGTPRQVAAGTGSGEEGKGHGPVQELETIQFFSFGRVHTYSATDHDQVLEAWQGALYIEAMFVLVTAQNLHGHYHAWHRDLAGFRAAGRLTKELSAFLGRAKEVDDARFENIKGSAQWVILKWIDKEDPTYRELHFAGVYLHNLRRKLWKLTADVSGYREQVAGGAETGQKGAELVESASLTILESFAKAKAAGNPYEEAAYRLIILNVQTAARGAGETIAGSSGERVIRQAAKLYREKAPAILIDLLTSPIKAKHRHNDKAASAVRKFVGALIDTAFQSAVKVIHGERDASRLLEEGSVNLMKSSLQLLLDAIAVTSDDERINELVNVVVMGAFDELKKAKDAARTEGRDVTAVLLAQLPWIMVGMAMQLVTGRVDRSISGSFGRPGGAFDATNDKAKAAEEVPSSPLGYLEFEGYKGPLTTGKAPNAKPQPLGDDRPRYTGEVANRAYENSQD